MDATNYPLILFPLVGLVFIALGIPLRNGKIPPNHFYGFRTRKTLSNEKIWYEVNRVTGQDMVRVGWVLVVSSMLLLALRSWLSPEITAAIQVIVMLVSVVWMAAHGFSILRKL